MEPKEFNIKKYTDTKLDDMTIGITNEGVVVPYNGMSIEESALAVIMSIQKYSLGSHEHFFVNVMRMIIRNEAEKAELKTTIEMLKEELEQKKEK